jgi:release factor glutamine methyltransferase
MPHRDAPPADTVGRLLHDCPLPAREARTLLAHCLERARESLVAHPELPVDPAARARFEAAVAQRRRGVPMAYLVGVQEFHGHRLQVTPDVLVPRPETELLVDTALELLRPLPGARVLELGTGSGCIAIALSLDRPDLAIVATERAPAALALARANCRSLGATVSMVLADWYAPVGAGPDAAASAAQAQRLAGPFELIVSNPPYVRADDPHLQDLAAEPRGALVDDKGDGLSALEAVIAGAPARLAHGGHVLVEHGHDQAPQVRALMAEYGLAGVRTLRDLEGRERACLGSLPGRSGPAGK